MIAYKFRSFDDVDHTLDIIFNKRLYCADWRFLNDPLEGMFYHQDVSTQEQSVFKRYIDDLIDLKHRYRVCSLCKTYNNRLLWAHYANGFNGLAVEVEIPDHDHKIKNIRYVSEHDTIFENDHFNIDSKVLDILTTKTKEWEYEDEVRIMSEDTYYTIPPVRRIILGHRVRPVMVKMIKCICENEGIELKQIDVDINFSINDIGDISND